MRRKSVYILAGVLFVIVSITMSCQVEKISQTQLKLARFSVKKVDLPEGWNYSGENWYQDLGGENYTVAYSVPDNPIISLAHTISAYPTEEKAKEAYPIWEDDVFSGVWHPWPDANFLPLNPDDLSRFECQQILSDTSIIGCNYLQLHGQFISYVLVNLDSKVMTFEQLNEILEILDRRLNEVSLND